jgi:hypothetical protein
MLPVNDAVDGTEKDGSSFVMKDDHHGRLNKNIEKQREPKLSLSIALSVEQQAWGGCSLGRNVAYKQ